MNWRWYIGFIQGASAMAAGVTVIYGPWMAVFPYAAIFAVFGWLLRGESAREAGE